MLLMPEIEMQTFNNTHQNTMFRIYGSNQIFLQKFLQQRHVEYFPKKEGMKLFCSIFSGSSLNGQARNDISDLNIQLISGGPV